MLWDYCRLSLDYQCTLLSDCDSFDQINTFRMDRNVSSIFLEKTPKTTFLFTFPVHFRILCLREAKDRIFGIGRSDFTFAHSTALPTALSINRVWCCCQRCCSLVSSAYSRLYSNQVRLWPSPCKVSPFWKLIYFGLVLRVAPSVKTARSQRGHILRPRLYFLILHVHEGRCLCMAANYCEVWRLS